MTLNEFIARATGYFDKAEKSLGASAELDAAKARVTELEGQLAAGKATIGERDTEIATLKGDLEKAQGEVNAKGGELKALQEKLTAEEKRTENVLAGMGIDPKKIPATAPKDAAKPAGATSAGAQLLDQLNAITDPTERTAFFHKNKAAIQAAWRAQD